MKGGEGINTQHGVQTNNCTQHDVQTNNCTQHDVQTNNCTQHDVQTNNCTQHDVQTNNCTQHDVQTNNCTLHWDNHTSLYYKYFRQNYDIGAVGRENVPVANIFYSSQAAKIRKLFFKIQIKTAYSEISRNWLLGHLLGN